MGDYSAAQIMAAISLALRESDMEAVNGLLHMLAVESPKDAELILSAIKALS